MVLLTVGSVIGCEDEFELVFLAVCYQPVFEEEFARGSGSGYQCHVPASEVDQKRQQRHQTCTTAYYEELVVVAYAERVPIGSSDDEYVPDVLLPEGCPDG